LKRFQRFVDRVAFTCWHANLAKAGDKLGEVIVAWLFGIEKRLRKPIPFVEEWLQLGDLCFSANSLLDSFQVTRELKKCFARIAALFASVVCCACFDYLHWLLSVRHRMYTRPKSLRRNGGTGNS